MKKLSFFLTLSAAFLLSSKITLAADPAPINVTVNPPSLEYTATATGTISDRFRIQNNATTPSDLTVKVVKITVNDAGDIAPAPVDSSDDWINWLKLDSNKITALPNEWVDVPFSISIPGNAALGYYYGLEIGPEAPTLETQGAKVSGKVLLPILPTVRSANAETKAEIQEFAPTSNIFEYPPINFTSKVKNTGNVALKPRGNIFITDSKGKQVGIVEVNPGNSTILPQQVREFNSVWVDSFIVRKTEVVNGQEKSHLEFNWNKLTDFRFGKFSSHLVMVYDNGERDVPMDASSSFWIIPYTPLAILIGGLIIIALLMKFLLGSYIKGQVKKQSR